jgi:hypothetical protein
MTAIALPFPRRRKSKPAQIAETATKAWASMKVGSTAAKTAKVGAKTAKTGAKTVASYKVVKFVGSKTGKLLLIPLAAGGGLLAWKRLRSNSASSESEPATPYGSPVGPVATPGTVTPPKTPGSTGGMNGEGVIADPPAGASNPPVTPPGSSS